MIEDEIKKQKIVERMIIEQDMVSFYANSWFNKSLNILQNYDDGLYYNDILKFIMENSEMLEKFSVKNLYNVLSACTKDEYRNRVNEFLKAKLENEEPFFDSLDLNILMKNFYTSNFYGKINEDSRTMIKEKIICGLKELKGTNLEKIAKKLRNYVDATNFLKYYRDGVFTGEKIEFLEEMADQNSNMLENINFGLLKDEIFDIGPDFVKYLSKFPSLSYQLVFLSNNSPNLLKVISDKVKGYERLEDNFDEIEILITYSARNAYKLKDMPINSQEFLECAYRNSNDFNLINVEYGENYEDRLNKELNNRYNRAEDINSKLDVYLNKVYSISLKMANQLQTEYGSDIKNLNLSEEVLTFFENLREIIKLDDKNLIDLMFKNDKRMFVPSQISQIKKEITRECAKDFSKEFNATGNEIDNQLEDTKEIEYDGHKIKQINLRGKFNLLVHSTDTEFIKETNVPENFKDDWYSNKDKKNHIISTTYINQEFMGMAPVGENGVRYGFAHLEESQIRLMGVTDLNTYSSSFAYDSSSRQYMSSKTLVNNSRRVYSEFGIERDNTNPDYVVICDDDLKEVIDNSYNAAIQFDIPIVYINKQKIAQNQINKLNSLIEEFEKTGDTNILKKLINTYETNMAGWLLNRADDIENDNSFTGKIDNSRFIGYFDEKKEEIKDLVKLFLSKGKDEKDIVNVIEILLNEIKLYEGCEKVKPISKTKISFDVYELLNDANGKLEEIGRNDLKVDLNAGENLLQYRTRIEELVRKSLSGEELITLDLIQGTKYKMQKLGLDNNLEDDTKNIEI